MPGATAPWFNEGVLRLKILIQNFWGSDLIFFNEVFFIAVCIVSTVAVAAAGVCACFLYPILGDYEGFPAVVAHLVHGPVTPLAAQSAQLAAHAARSWLALSEHRAEALVAGVNMMLAPRVALVANDELQPQCV